jgi:hypothetical protein
MYGRIDTDDDWACWIFGSLAARDAYIDSVNAEYAARDLAWPIEPGDPVTDDNEYRL